MSSNPAIPTTHPSAATRKRLKVHTGCVTCKIRRVKCDEGKPACKRCTDTGRKCDGYAPPQGRSTKKNGDRSVVMWAQPRPETMSNTSKKLAPVKVAARTPPTTTTAAAATTPQVSNSASSRSASITSDVASISSTLSGEERQWIGFFSVRTGPALSNVLNHPFWAYTLPQMSHSQPAILHAMIGVSSFHARYEAEVAKNHQVLGIITKDFVARQYNQAVRLLQDFMKRDQKDTDIPLICCLLFICLECLYGYRDLVISHLQNGLNILHSTSSSSTPSSSPSKRITIKDMVRPIFHRLDSQSTLFGKDASLVFSDIQAIPQLCTPSRFSTLEDAKRSLDHILGSGLAFAQSAYYRDVFREEENGRSHTAVELQSHLLTQFDTWRKGMDYLVNLQDDLTHTFTQEEKLLRMQHAASLIWVASSLSKSEQTYDSFLPIFTSIISWATKLISLSTHSSGLVDPNLCSKISLLSISSSSSSSSPPRFSLNMSFLPPLYLVAIKCRDPRLRRQAARILIETQGKEGLWDARIHGRVARRVIEVEETGMFLRMGGKQVLMEEGEDMRMVVDGQVMEVEEMQIPEDGDRIRDTKIREIGERDGKAVSVEFHMQPDEGGVVWKEMVWFA